VPVEHFDEFRNIAFQRIRQAQEDDKARQHQAAFDIADERDTRSAVFSDVALRQSSGEPELPQMRTEKLSFFRRLWLHEYMLSCLTTVRSRFIVNDKHEDR
jgi:hypothetical protein